MRRGSHMSSLGLLEVGFTLEATFAFAATRMTAAGGICRTRQTGFGPFQHSQSALYRVESDPFRTENIPHTQ